jgi:hypothetical protein
MNMIEDILFLCAINFLIGLTVGIAIGFFGKKE